jgi:hypothetical protein
MPEEATLSLDSFARARECGECHARHYEEWSSSVHAYAMLDPVFRALVERQREDVGSQRDPFCTQCHSPLGTRSRDIQPGFSFDELSPLTLEGVTCENCHRVVELDRPFNSGHRIESDAPLAGPILGADAPHATTFSPLHDSSEFCAGCHDVVAPGGLTLEAPYQEWLDSPAARKKNCQSCHMPTYDGQAASLEGAPLRRGLHSHRFIGVEVPSTPEVLANPALRARAQTDVDALLASAASLDLTGPASARRGATATLTLSIRNLIDGHALPTGSSFNRQLWISIEADDEAGHTASVMGGLDPSGDVESWPGSITGANPGGELDLIAFGSVLQDGAGLRVPFTWQAESVISNALGPIETRRFTCRVVMPPVGGRWTLTARLLFRPLDPALPRALRMDEVASRRDVVELARASWSLTASAGAAIGDPLSRDDGETDPDDREDDEPDGAWPPARCRHE